MGAQPWAAKQLIYLSLIGHGVTAMDCQTCELSQPHRATSSRGDGLLNAVAVAAVKLSVEA